MRAGSLQRCGSLGEAIARRYLVSKGYTVREANFPTPFGEIDIVAEHAEYTVFAEVKTRTGGGFGSPFAAITHYKRKNLIKNAFYYMKRRGLCDAPCRIDCIGINIDRGGNLLKLEHIENAIDMLGWEKYA